MPVAISVDATAGQPAYCVRCHTQPPNLVVRMEHLCRVCFMNYIATKVLKRLESNKLRGGFHDRVKTLLLPISFGISSIALLHVLDHQLHRRLEQGRHAGYKLHVLFVDQSVVSDKVPPQSMVGPLQQRYPSHSYSTISIKDASEFGIDAGNLLYGARRSLTEIISSLPSATSKADFIDVIRHRLIVAYAERNGCDSILYGDSTTRLAERTLSETAKGRGVSLPGIIADSDSSRLICAYPLRDVLRKELLAYVNFVTPPLTALVIEPEVRVPTSSRDITIDGLMGQYFESVEQHSPSIVTNVVRTSGKLVANATSEKAASCSLCGSPIVDGGWGGEQDGTTPTQAAENRASRQERSLCYGCARTVPMD